MNTRRFRLFTALLAALLALCAAAGSPLYAHAADNERILSFDASVVIEPDAALTVTETITVLAAGETIRHGIVREFPTRYEKPDGTAVTVGFCVLSVTRDGRKEDYHIKDASNGKKVFMGDKDALLPPGRHTYVLTYRTDGQIGRFSDTDELYWNVTGNGWRLPIDAASATVNLPHGAKVVRHAAYTGPKGAKGRDFTAEKYSGMLRFATTAPLPPGQGLTVAVAFPKGFVHPPTPTERMLTAPAFRVAAAGLVAVAVYFLTAWWKVGRDPRRGVTVPRFEPPAGFSAPGARYVRRMGFDDRTLAAGLVQMAVDGGLVIEDTGDFYVLSRGEVPFPQASWQEAVAQRLLGHTGVIQLTQANRDAVKAAKKSLRAALAEVYQGTYFHANRAFFWIGAALSAAVMGLTAMRAEDPDTASTFIVLLGVWTFFVSGMTIKAFAALRRAKSRPGIKTVLAAFFLTLIVLPFWIGEAVGAAFLSMTVSVPASIALTLIGVLNAVFWHLLKAPTPEGRRVMDAIEGFRLYLSIGEKERLELLTPPERTIELFERNLPYAMALGVENAWAAQFKDAIDRAAAEGYAPAWYVGGHWSASGSSDFAGAFSDGFSSAIAAASTSPGSSSGSGGGGSSGGGGGGGGGGGW